MGIKGGCNDPECCASSDISEELTFGKGELDDLGYWEFPCDACMNAYIAANRFVCTVCKKQYGHETNCGTRGVFASEKE